MVQTLTACNQEVDFKQGKGQFIHPAMCGPSAWMTPLHPHVLPHGARIKKNKNQNIQDYIKATCSPYIPRKHLNTNTGEGGP